jgi:hypothetical protein
MAMLSCVNIGLKCSAVATEQENANKKLKAVTTGLIYSNGMQTTDKR